MKDELHEAAQRLLLGEGWPRLSVFAPMEKAGPDIRQNPIRFKNLVREAGDNLEQCGVADAARKETVANLLSLLEDSNFWAFQEEGLAIFATAHEKRYYRLPVKFSEKVHVGERFLVLPLLPLLEWRCRLLVLALSSNRVRLFEADRYDMREVDPGQDAPKSLTDAVGRDREEQHLQFHTGGSESGTPIYHGQGGGKNDVRPELERYCRLIEAGLSTELSRRDTPLLPAGDPVLTAVFRDVASTLTLTEQTLTGNFDDARATEIHKNVIPILREREDAFAAGLAGRYSELRKPGRVSHDAKAISAAAREGRVEQLLISAPGIHSNKDIDLRNDIAIDTLRASGKVQTLSESRMPTTSILAAIFRY